MDTFLAIVSKRDTRRYADRPIPEETVQRILDRMSCVYEAAAIVCSSNASVSASAGR